MTLSEARIDLIQAAQNTFLSRKVQDFKDTIAEYAKPAVQNKLKETLEAAVNQENANLYNAAKEFVAAYEAETSALK